MASIQEHFLFVTDPLQSHINPARRLAVRVAAAIPNARVTFSTAISGHRHMFPHLTSPDGEVLLGVISYIPYSDGFDGGFKPEAHGTAGVGAYRERARAVGTETLTAIIARLARRGHPVTRVVYTALVGWVPAVARAHGVPAALYWVKPATVFAVYYHYIHGHGCVSDPDPNAAVALLPGLPPLKPDALPSFASMTTPGSRNYLTLDMLRDIFLALDDEHEDRPTVLVDTFDALEPEALRAVPRFNLAAVGPVVVDEPCLPCMEMFQPDDAKAYVEWLDTKPARSVVFASFGSVLSLSKRQDEELRRGLEATGRPYLLVARRKGISDDDSGRGMVAEWCNQTKVLSHHAVGCFVTHCRWDSALESITGGVPMVAVPRWGDQPAVAALVEASQGVGVRACLDGEGVVERGELLRCVEAVMGSTESAAAVRARAERLRQRAKEAAAVGGTSHRSLLAFASGM
ncbi:hypothetical protein U9M48_027110 [Paspalum notatum var. saurae]|uniref:Glycosyltransferase n=1 Tax=Paspalum notatum var. saurae TaxID=547442 RepID=A0AAQ3TU20_PASNO